MLWPFACRFSFAVLRFLRSRDGAVSFLLTMVGVVCLVGFRGMEPERPKLVRNERLGLSTEARGASNPRQSRSIKDVATELDRQQQIAGGTKSDLVRFRNFFFRIAPWVIGSLLAIRFGYFSSVKKLGKLAFVLLCAVTIIVLVGSQVVGRSLRSLGVENVQAVEIVIIICAVVVWLITTIRIFAVRPKNRQRASNYPVLNLTIRGCRPTIRFSAVGGMDGAKEQIRRVVQSCLNQKSYRRYRVVQNGVLLHGPRGSGKTFLAEATAGEFNLNYFYLSPTAVLNMWMGRTEENIRDCFLTASANRPALLFIDEIDALGSSRRSTDSDHGGARQAYNNQVLQLTQCIDQYRGIPRLVLMAATNVLDNLDPALIREGRFDFKVRVDLPDRAAREKILESQLSKRSWKQFDLRPLAVRTPGYSAAKLQVLVDRAATIAADENRRIEAGDLNVALAGMGGEDRPLLEPVAWDDVILEAEVEQVLKDLIGLLNDSGLADKWKVRPPSGVLLIGPPGTGKSLVARLIATQTRRSFYPASASDILGSNVGDSVKTLRSLFERAKDNSPSIIFFDEMDGLLPRVDGGHLNQHDIQLVEEFLTQTTKLMAENNILLIGASNFLDRIDPRALRGGRFSEKIQIGLPSQSSRERLFLKFLDGMPLAADTTLGLLAMCSEGFSSADIEAVCETAKRFAYHRVKDKENARPTLSQNDFKRAIERVRVTVYPLV